MWKIIPNSSYISEPEVVRNLKQLLDKNICNCKVCSVHENSLLIHNNNKQVQVTDQDLFNTTGQGLKLRRTQSQTLQNNIFCPGCYMAMNLCRQKDTKFLKDEESETKTEIFYRDKSTEQEVNVVEKSTSDTDKTEHNNTVVSTSQDFFQYSAVSCLKIDNRSLKNEVPLLYKEVKLGTMPAYSNCLCIANFINSIRPPLSDNDIYDM